MSFEPNILLLARIITEASTAHHLSYNIKHKAQHTASCKVLTSMAAVHNVDAG